MARPLRIEMPDAWYHVMSRGRRGEKVFRDQHDYQGFIDLIKESCSMWQVRIGAYCLMPNHYHLLIQTPDANLARCMRHVNGVYTQRFNRRYESDGQLFRGRYKSILVDADHYLLDLLRYIHRNPLRAGIVKSLGAYAWSSHKGYLLQSLKWKWLAKDFIFSLLTENKAQRRSAYIRFIKDDESDEINKIFSQGKLPAVLGAQEFLEKIKKKFYKAKQHKDIPESQCLAPDVEQIIKAVCCKYHLSEGELYKPRRGKSNEPRKVAMYLIRKHTGLSLVEIGKKFTMNNYSSVGSVVLRIKKQLFENKSFRNQVEKIEKNL